MSSFTAFLLEVLVNAAKIDGDAADAEIDAIAAAMTDATKTAYARTDAQAAIARAALSRADLVAHLKKSGRAFSKEERMALLRHLFTVVAADGKFEEAERTALLAYIEAIGFEQAPSVLDAIMQPFRNAV